MVLFSKPMFVELFLQGIEKYITGLLMFVDIEPVMNVKGE